MLPTATPFDGDWWTKGAGNLRMMERALKEGHYPLTFEHRAEMVEMAAEVMRTAKSKRTRLAAIKVLAALDGLNVKRDQGPKQTNHLHIHGTDDARTELAGILAALRERRGDSQDILPIAGPTPE